MSAGTDSTSTEEYGALRDMMIEVRTRLDILIAQTAATHSDHEARLRAVEQRPNLATALGELGIRFVDHETRMRSIERRLWVAAGAAMAGGGAIGTWLGQVLGS